MHMYGSVIGDDVRWVQTGRGKRTFELRSGESGERASATLEWRGGYGAVGAWADGQRYRFSREGWLRPRVVVRADGSEAPIATMMRQGGTLACVAGPVFTWRKPERWTHERDWVDAAGHVVIRFHPGGGQTAVAVVAPPAEPLPELALLMLLGQYLIVLAAREAEDAMTAAIASVVVSAS